MKNVLQNVCQNVSFELNKSKPHKIHVITIFQNNMFVRILLIISEKKTVPGHPELTSNKIWNNWNLSNAKSTLQIRKYIRIFNQALGIQKYTEIPNTLENHRP